MKQLLTFVMLMCVGLFMSAQPTIVSTTASNRNVLIEEYTGIHCGYCPNGHSYGNTVLAAHPNNAWVMNIHQGSYAVPSTGEPDYRTTYGDALAGQIGLSGYPCGTVNRHVFSGSVTDVDYTTWPTVANTVLAMASPVNIAIDVDLDYVTRQLTVLVEVYYTSNSATSTNKLNVALLQDWIKGPQSNYGNYNAAYITPDGKYWHMHMLRELLTGQWGITIPTTTAGTFWDSTFTYTVPATFGAGAIPVELPNLQVVAFVTEGNQEVLNVHGMHVPAAAIDASVTAISGMPTDICATSFIPTVTITNKGLNTLTSLDIDYSLDGGAVQTYAWTGSLATDASADVILPSIAVSTSGSHSFEAATNNPNADVDYNTVNDANANTFTSILSSINAPVTQNFTSTTFPPADWALTEATQNGSNWARSSQGCFAGGSAYINWFNIPSGVDDLMSYKMDFSSLSDAALTFNYAYRQYNTYADKLQVDVSTNCGSSWTTLWTKSGAQLATTTASTAGYTTVLAAHWRFITIDLSTYAGQSDVLLRFRATSAYGNNLYLDDINISSNVGINDIGVGSDFTVYPNPANDFTTININSESASNATITVVNAVGEVVYNSSTWLNAGANNLNINTENYNNGVYFIRIQTIEGIMNSSFVVGR